MKLRFLTIVCVSLAIIGLSIYSDKEMLPAKGGALDVILSSNHFKRRTVKSVICELTAYCPGPCCNTGFETNGAGKFVEKDWSNKIAAGSVTIKELHAAGVDIAAVDTSVIPYGTIIKYNGKLYAALDCGGMITGDKIDLSVDTHAEADRFGRRPRQTVELYIPADPKGVIKRILDSTR